MKDRPNPLNETAGYFLEHSIAHKQSIWTRRKTETKGNKEQFRYKPQFKGPCLLHSHSMTVSKTLPTVPRFLPRYSGSNSSFHEKKIMRLRAWQIMRCFNSWSITRAPEFLSYSNISNSAQWQWKWVCIYCPHLPCTRLKLHYDILVEKHHSSQPPQPENSDINMLLTCKVCALSRSGKRKQKDQC